MFFENIFNQSIFFIFACGLLAILVAEAALKYSRPWATPALVGYATIAGWYLLEPLYFPEEFTAFDTDIVDAVYIQVIEFLIWLRIFIWLFSRISLQIVGASSGKIATIPASKLFYYCALLWLFLLSIGIYRMNGDYFGALFPIASRTGGSMWSRGAAGSAGDMGFLVSTAGYLYTLACASFGILLPLIGRRSTKLLAILLVLASWPYFLLQGSRNVFLAVFLPSFASYMIFSRQKILVKCVLAIVLFLGVNYSFHVVLNYRDVGFEKFFSEEANRVRLATKHVGLGMMSELCFMNTFYDAGILNLSYGLGYVQEFINFIPRVIWPGKPMLGIDYTILRGFAGKAGDIGVIATISSGLIGQGFLSFGPFFGPAAAAIIFGAWIAILARLWKRRESVPRAVLFLIGLGLTFNLGRDFTLLVLWPFVFGYAIVRILEMKKKSSGQFAREGSIRTVDLGSPAKKSTPRWQ